MKPQLALAIETLKKGLDLLERALSGQAEVATPTPEEKPAAKSKAKKKEEPVEETEEAGEDRTVFTQAEPAKTPGEITLFKAHWKNLRNQKLQDAYLEGKIDSVGDKIGGADEEEVAVEEEITEQSDDDFSFDGEAEEEVSALTYADINALAQKLGKAKGKDAVLKIMAKFKLKAMSALAQEDYPKFAEALEAALAKK